MSTDWIKMRVDLRTHPKVVRMAGALNADKLRVVGALHAVWSIFDAHSSDGLLDGYTFKALDIELGWKGFAQAMHDIGWLIDSDGEGLEAPRFEEHNGQSAKRRAMETERKRLEREAEKAAADAAKAATNTGQVSASHADKSVTREEKRREEEKENPPASRVPPKASPRAAKKCPESFAVTDDLRKWAREKHPGVDLVAETEVFLDHTFATARTDWDGTWRNWIRKAATARPGWKPARGSDNPFEGAH